MYYSIAGHIFEIEGEELGNIPGFSHFLSESHLLPKPLISVQLDKSLSDKEAELLYHFTIEKDFCNFSRNDDCYIIRWQQADGIFWTTEIRSEAEKFIVLTSMNKDTDIHVLRSVFWIAFGIAAIHKQTVAIHSSAITYSDKSILFLGESGTGKSTHSQLWLQHIDSTELLNDDSPFININKKGTLIAWGTPWSGKTPCYKNVHTSIAAFVRLRQAPFNSIRRLRTIEAIGALHPSLSPILSTIPALADLTHECLSSILWQKPVYILDCLPNKDAVDLVFATLKKDGWL